MTFIIDYKLSYCYSQKLPKIHKKRTIFENCSSYIGSFVIFYIFLRVSKYPWIVEKIGFG